MPRRLLLVLACFCAATLKAQNFDNIQIHGFATQGFLFSSNNNYLTMNSSTGSMQWTEGALNVTDSVTDKLRVGIQVHMYQMGEFGGPNLVVDWASGDYKFNDQIGVRAGKIKVRLGLFNDSQDVDSLFLWVLLPQSIYPDDNRDYDLAALGGEVYGDLRLGSRRGSLQYSGHVGNTTLDANGGYMRQLAQYGLVFPSPPSGSTSGGDLRWLTPLRGLTIGAGAANYALDGAAPAFNFHMPGSLNVVYYAQWDHGRWHLAGEYYRSPLRIVINTGDGASALINDFRCWYPMLSYSVTRKLQLGSYYSVMSNHAGDTSLPENYSKDWVLSSRYDFNPYFYGKIEGHFLHGTGAGYYNDTNLNGLKPNSTMLAARIGFSF